MRQITVIDDDNEIVQEYEDDNTLISDCLSYKFTKVLPVIEEKGVELIEEDTIEFSIE